MHQNLRITLIALFLLSSSFAFSQEKKPSLDAKSGAASANSPTYQLQGSALLLSNFVHHGLTQTNKDPSLQSSFWFNFGPQFRLGIWGSNVNYVGNDSHVWIRLNADVKVQFSDASSLGISYSDNKYYAANSRNGNTVALNLNLFGYGVIYELESNWEGTETRSTYFAFQKTYLVFGDWAWDNQVGYSMLTSSSMQNYFDLRTFIGNHRNSFEYKAGLTWTSSPSQFNGRGDLFFILAIGVGF